MELFVEQELFTLKEVAKWCNISRNAVYMHYYRGHIEPVKAKAHKLYFTRASIDKFRAEYLPFN